MAFDHYDVAIIGGGPAGSTTGTILKKYAPDQRVGIFEKDRFPREHVGESQLPSIGFILHEMGVWDKVEAANFPIKIGATYVWGKSDKPWDFEFIPIERFPANQARPAKYDGPRRQTALQVDRAIYDNILLQHAEELGCEVSQEVGVKQVDHDGDRVTGLTLGDGRSIDARYYVDGSGSAGIIRRALEIGRDVPTKLKNIAVWDYWENAEWATTIGIGGTRVQVLSLTHGWIWFIPIGPTRTSIGFICPSDHYKRLGISYEQLYEQAVNDQPRVRALCKNAVRDGEVRATTDWSFVSDRVSGENWFLAGDSAGFADPILAGGLTLTHSQGRHTAYTILELDRGNHDPAWLHRIYHDITTTQIRQFIRFADYWYAANGQFEDLQDITAEIAEDAGLTLTPEAAFRWLSLGGFSSSDGARPGVGGLDLGAIREVMSIFTGRNRVKWRVNQSNIFRLSLNGAKEDTAPVLADGRIERARCYRRGKKSLPAAGVFRHVIEVLEQHSDIESIMRTLQSRAKLYGAFSISDAVATLETMILDGWVQSKSSKKHRFLRWDMNLKEGDTNFHANRDLIEGLAEGQ